ncbi:MAG: RNA polymerase sigma factor, partial [Butyricimonas paravirosa]
ELYDRFYDELVLWADTILNDMGEAEDLVQDFFVRLWEKKLNENLEGERVRSYLYVSVRNMAIRKVKDQSRMRRIPDISVVERVWEDEEVTHEDMIDQVLKALDVLPPRSREVLECVHLKNMKYAEVAELLGISVATVKTLLVRSLKTLRGLFLIRLFCCTCLFKGEDQKVSIVWKILS